MGDVGFDFKPRLKQNVTRPLIQVVSSNEGGESGNAVQVSATKQTKIITGTFVKCVFRVHLEYKPASRTHWPRFMFLDGHNVIQDVAILNTSPAKWITK
jgi:hypothetical protein